MRFYRGIPMKPTQKSYIVSNISLPINASLEEAFSLAARKLASVGIHPRDALYSIYRRSTDARKRSDIKFVYSVLVRGDMPPLPTRASSLGISEANLEEPRVIIGDERLSAPPVVVGSGPAGLFAALILAENGYKPILIERGGDVAERNASVERFKRERVLDPNTNIQFGAGGAGTFSDGKLLTRINDPMSSYVLSGLVRFGAPSEITYLAKPHIGTDILSVVVENIISKIRELGGEVHYHTRLIDFTVSSSSVTSVVTNNGVIAAGALILAIGHSARDTYELLFSKNVSVEAKDFSVGLRIEHPTEVIDRGMYGDLAGHAALGHAEYTLSHDTKNRGVYTFCMCPGGEVVAAASEEGGVVVNGMSHHARSGKNSNSAVCTSIFKSDYGATPRAAIEFQRNIERAAFSAGGSDYSAPIITVGDFLRGECRNAPSEVIPTYMEGVGVRLASPEKYLPKTVTDALRGAIPAFDRKISGFALDTAVLTGPETRTSAPVRILRNNETRLALGYDNFYPAGEGAGYAGGITSAAIDGVRCALSLMKKYRHG